MRAMTGLQVRFRQGIHDLKLDLYNTQALRVQQAQFSVVCRSPCRVANALVFWQRGLAHFLKICLPSAHFARQREPQVLITTHCPHFYTHQPPYNKTHTRTHYTHSPLCAPAGAQGAHHHLLQALRHHVRLPVGDDGAADG